MHVVVCTKETPDTAAKVGDYEVSFGELQQSHTQLEQRYREIYGEAFSPELSKQLNLPMV